MGQNLDTMAQNQQSKEEVLYQMVRPGNVEAIKTLRREGASLEWIDKEGKTPLIVACMDFGLFDVAKALIELGANVNAYRPGRNAGTPLHHAAKRGLHQTLNLLLSSGANALVRNDDCQTSLDVARTKGHLHVVRTIENHICYFSGWLREFYGPGFLEALAPQIVSSKIWVVVIPCGYNNQVKQQRLQLVIYPMFQDIQPRTVISLCKAKIEEPKFDHSDPQLIIFDQSNRTRYKFASAITGDKQQLHWLYDACRGISQFTLPPTQHAPENGVESAGHETSSEATELSLATSPSIQSATDGRPAVPNVLQSSGEINTNGWENSPHPDSHNAWEPAAGPTHSVALAISPSIQSATDDRPAVPNALQSSGEINANGCENSLHPDSHNAWEPAAGPTHSVASSSGWSDEAAKEDYNGWGVSNSGSTGNQGWNAGTPSHHAAKRGLHQTSNLLLSSANALVRNDDCQTALDVARTKGHLHVVRTIEYHICYFSGWIREFYGLGFLEAQAPQFLSSKIWVVVIPCGYNNQAEEQRLQLVIYPTFQDIQPRTVISLWKAKIEEPKFDHSDPQLIIFDLSTRTRYKFASATTGDKQQLHWLYDACRGISQFSVPPNENIVQASESMTASVPLTPSAPPIPYEGDGPIHYSSINSSPVDGSAPAIEHDAQASVTTDSSSSCIICWEAPVEGACIPCGHMAGCMKCLNGIKANKGPCPICRANLNQVIKVYAV